MPPHKAAFPAPCPPPPTPPQPAVLPLPLPLSHPHAAGIDIGEAEHWVAVPPDRSPQPVRRFGTCTADLDALADWLLDCSGTTVAMASTGVSWMPVCDRWEARGLQGLLIDPRQAKRAPGRPTTERLACHWLQRLHAYGRLAAACRPDDQRCVLRRALRHRQMLRTYGAHPMQPRHKAWPQMHRTLSQVVSDLPGATGMAILHAIIAGERAPMTLAQLRHPHGQPSADAIVKALQGPWRAEPLLALRQAVARSPCSHQPLARCAQPLHAQLDPFAAQSDGQPLPPKARRHKNINAPRFDARPPLSRLAGVALTTLEGIEAGTALGILAEMGTDMRRWPSVKPLCRWLGLAPPHTISGGTVLSRPVRPGAPRVALALRLAARSVPHARTALGAFLRRRRSRLGAPKAITATAHKRARLVDRL